MTARATTGRWRNRTARAEAVPAYAILTNQQLVDLVRRAPSTKAGVQQIEGIGKKRAERWADAILAITAGNDTSAGGSDAPPFEVAAS
ncbi:MAG: HRDC domain-containing protein [Planctomycetota bacterium]